MRAARGHTMFASTRSRHIRCNQPESFADEARDAFYDWATLRQLKFVFARRSNEGSIDNTKLRAAGMA
eukprot:9758145-Alexandrium_andersonii.AAC.1